MKKPVPSAAPVAFSYVRFSTPEQAKGDSLRRQTEAAAEWCRRNHARLDEGTTLHDLGKSAYTGTHRQNPDRNALAAFLKLVESGRVPRGSYLVIENLDRLSREHIQPALLLVLNLLQAGVRIVQLAPAEMVFDEKSEAMQVMMMVMELTRGHGESAIKAERLARAWEAKRGDIGRRKMTGKVPFWLTLSADRTQFREKPEAVATVRRVFQLARDGYGSTALAKRLNAEGVLSPYGRPWNNVSVLWLLRNRAVLGEYTPHRGRGGKRIPAGPPVGDYYPRVVSDQEFWAVQTAIQFRKNQRGRRGKFVRNLFTGLLRDGRDGDPIHLTEKRPGDVRMVSYGAMRGKDGARYVSFPYAAFERAVLARLREIDPAEVLGRDDGPDESMALAGELARVESKIAELEAELENGDVPALARALRAQEERRRDLAEKLSEARARAASPLSDAWGEYRTLADVLDQAPDPEETRTRLRGVLRRMVESMTCLFVARGATRLAAVQVDFAGVGKRRSYLVGHRAGGEGWCRSFADAAPAADALDLRKRKDAAKLARALEDFDPAAA